MTFARPQRLQDLVYHLQTSQFEAKTVFRAQKQVRHQSAFALKQSEACRELEFDSGNQYSAMKRQQK